MLQILHVSHQAMLNATRPVTRIHQADEEKCKFLNQKSLAFTLQIFLYIFPEKTYHIFGFWASQGLTLNRNTCFVNLSLLWW